MPWLREARHCTAGRCHGEIDGARAPAPDQGGAAVGAVSLFCMTEVIKAWQCIGCGKLEAPQNCIGVCQDRRVELVYASEHEEAQRELSAARERHEMLASIRLARLGANARRALRHLLII